MGFVDRNQSNCFMGAGKKEKLVPAPVSYETYKMFAKRYKIRVTHTINGVRRPKPIKLLRAQIKKHEQTHRVRNGLYV